MTDAGVQPRAKVCKPMHGSMPRAARASGGEKNNSKLNQYNRKFSDIRHSGCNSDMCRQK
jgi:hypothetical protein